MKTANLLRTGVGAALILVASAVDAAPHRVVAHYMEPRLHPDETRRTVKPPSRADFGDRMQFTSIRSIPDHPGWKRELDRYVVSNRLGNVLWPNLTLLANRNLPDVIREVKARGLWLFDVWGYLPYGRAQGVEGLWRMPEGVPELLEHELGMRWLGMDNGEQDGRWAAAGRPGLDRFACQCAFQRYFEHMDRELGNKMAALVSLNYGHYFLRENCYTMIGAETAQALPNSQVYYAFCRGAGRQYGVPWFGNVSIFNRWGWKSYSAGEAKSRPQCGPTKGTSLALMKKLLYAQLFYNGLACGFEGAFFYGPERQGRLSPIGEIQREANDWIGRHGDPGVMQVPVALMIDSGRGWAFPRNIYGWPNVCWGSVPFERGDFLTHGVIDLIYPGYAESGFFRDERGFNAPTPYGDIADCLLSDAPLWLLKDYPLLILAGPLEPSAELADTLAAYVAAGGHLVLTEGNRVRLFPRALPPAANGGRVTLIPSDWGVSAECRVRVTKRFGDEEPYACSYPLTDATRQILDRVLREQTLFATNPDGRADGLSLIACRRGAGDYTLCVANNTWEERPFELSSNVGRILSVEELATLGRERAETGYLPEVMSNAVVGTDGPRTIAGGSVRMLRVKVAETGVEVLPTPRPPANPKNRTLYLRSNEEIKVQLMRRPTFFRHFDSVMVDWRYVFDRDDEALRYERNWIRLQGLDVLVDFRSGLNAYPDYCLTENVPHERDRSQAAFRKLLGKASVLGVREIVLGRHKLRGKGREIEDRKAEFERNVAAFARDAAARGIVVRFCNDAWDTHAANRLVRACGEANLRPAQELAAWQHPHPQQALEKVRAQACDFWFLGQPLRTDVTCEPFFTSCGRLADSTEPDLDALLKAVLDKKGRVVFSADYPDVDSEYRDVSLVERLADR